MSSKDLAVSVRGLSKSYTIAHNAEQHSTLGEAFLHRARNPFQRPQKETFWALKDVSFDINKGEVVGIIGRNGAGKSTLLKILSQITEPTKGEVQLYGRVGSLLEVGTGFHPELSGRENIYLNGAILGMRRSEINRQFDAIVDFAEVGQFLDTPVKRYSSGMYVRLAFAVAAHLNPEILVVDEVLAVGDAAFQKKCLGKMGEVASQEGKTVLFVSHNMAAVRNLCSHGVVLEHGEIACNATIAECVNVYSLNGQSQAGSSWRSAELPSGRSLTVCSVDVSLEGQQPRHVLHINSTLTTWAPHKPAFVALDIAEWNGVTVMQAIPLTEGIISDRYSAHTLDISIQLPPLIPGRYSVTLWVGSHNSETLDQVKNCVTFDIEDSPTVGRSFPHTSDHGWIVPQSSLEYTPSLYPPRIGDANLGVIAGADEPVSHAH